MDQREYEALLASIEQMIETSLRGYHRGNHFHIPGRLEEMAQEHHRLYNGSDYDSGDRYLDSSAREHREGCRGLKPEGTY